MKTYQLVKKKKNKLCNPTKFINMSAAQFQIIWAHYLQGAKIMQRNNLITFSIWCMHTFYGEMNEFAKLIYFENSYILNFVPQYSITVKIYFRNLEEN